MSKKDGMNPLTRDFMKMKLKKGDVLVLRLNTDEPKALQRARANLDEARKAGHFNQIDVLFVTKDTDVFAISQDHAESFYMSRGLPYPTPDPSNGDDILKA